MRTCAPATKLISVLHAGRSIELVHWCPVTISAIVLIPVGTHYHEIVQCKQANGLSHCKNLVQSVLKETSVERLVVKLPLSQKLGLIPSLVGQQLQGCCRHLDSDRILDWIKGHSCSLVLEI